MERIDVVSLLAGGAVALISSLTVFGITKWVEWRERREERKRNDATNAWLGFQKLMVTINSIENLATHIDDQFKEGADRSLNDPAALIKPIIGERPALVDVTPLEISFLSGGDGELPSAIWEIQQRARNNNAVVAEYNRIRQEYDAFLLANASDLDAPDGTMLSATLEGRAAQIAALEIGRMNQLLAHLIVALEEDRPTVFSVAEQYLKAAKKEFGDLFPAASIERRERPNA